MSKAYTLSQLISTGTQNSGGVTSFDSRTGAITLTASDVSTALGFTPGPTGGGSDRVFWLNSPTVASSFTISNAYNAMAAGPLIINQGVTVTIQTGARLAIV